MADETPDTSNLGASGQAEVDEARGLYDAPAEVEPAPEVEAKPKPKRKPATRKAKA